MCQSLTHQHLKVDRNSGVHQCLLILFFFSHPSLHHTVFGATFSQCAKKKKKPSRTSTSVGHFFSLPTSTNPQLPLTVFFHGVVHSLQGIACPRAVSGMIADNASGPTRSQPSFCKDQETSRSNEKDRDQY